MDTHRAAVLGERVGKNRDTLVDLPVGNLADVNLGVNCAGEPLQTVLA